MDELIIENLEANYFIDEGCEGRQQTEIEILWYRADGELLDDLDLIAIIVGYGNFYLEESGG